VPATSSYDYAIIRVVPLVERGECINIGVILFCRTQRFLDMAVHLDEQRLRAFAPALDFGCMRQQVEALVQVCHGGAGSGPIGQLSQAERFHWLVSPRSTVVQISPVHCGICGDPAGTLRSLLRKLVETP
jgi:Protein of unknown function (DUF3037)